MKKKFFLLYFFLFNTLLSKNTIFFITGRKQELHGVLFSTPEKVYPTVPAYIKLFKKLPQEIFKKTGYQIKTPNSYSQNLRNEYIVIFDTPPRGFPFHLYKPSQLILVMIEPPTIIPLTHQKNYQAKFGKILTWNDALVDNRKYFKYWDWACYEDMIENIIPFEEKKFCCLVATNVSANHHPKQLYSQRLKVINYFEHHEPELFDLYGRYWPRKFKVYNNIILFGKQAKINTIKNYKFYICYENMRDVQGYITEKIFDCFHAGCVPVYWGASNITNYIPKSCFIDRRNFSSNQEMVKFLKNITKDEYETYLQAIKRFLTSEESYFFTIECFIEQFIKSIVSR